MGGNKKCGVCVILIILITCTRFWLWGEKVKSLYDYSDYRLFLKEYKEHRVLQNPSFSYRYLAMKAGISSTSFYSHIIKGARNLSKQTIRKTANGLNLDSQEAKYFENLVFFNQAKTMDDKNHFFNELIKLRKSDSVKKVDSDQYEYFSKWYHCAVRELVCYLDCGKEYELIASYLKPKVTASEVEESVTMLLSLGFICFDGKNMNFN